jgi:flagellar biosynthesis protein FliP
MGPVAEAIGARTAALDPQAQSSPAALLAAAREPARAFLQRNAGQAETRMLLDLPPPGGGTPRSADDLSVLWASFALTELKEAFELGFFVYLPFLVLDLVVSHALLALGIVSLSPSLVALPFKLLLFVSADGFLLITRALLASYG